MLRVLAIIVGVVVVAIGALAAWSYPVWGGWGAWHAMPSGDAPRSHYVADPAFARTGAAALDALVDHRDQHGFPALTAAVSLDGELVWSGAVGWSDLEHEQAADRDTAFRIGSTSKAVTATLLARLVDRGEIALDTPIGELGVDWPNSAWAVLTPRQLASHTAGLPGYDTNTDRAGQWQTLCGCRRYDSVADSLAIVDGSDLLFEPGADFAYSSFDVNILGAALAEVAGETYLEALDTHVFSPLGLAQSRGAEVDASNPDRAEFYQIQHRQARLWKPFDLSQRWPGGGLVSTSEELVQIGGAWLDEDFISAQTRQAFWTPQPLDDGTVNEQNYAIGWRYAPQASWPGDERFGLPFAHHGGVSKGAMSWLVVYPDVGLSVAVNINTRAETFADFAAVEDVITALFLDSLVQQGRVTGPSNADTNANRDVDTSAGG